MHALVSLGVVLAVLTGFANSVDAQETRAEAIEQAQAERRRLLQPPGRSTGEVIIERLERWGVFTGKPGGWYPWLGSVHPGGGLAAGGGYSRVFGDDGAIDAVGGYSIRSFSSVGGAVSLPSFASGRARVILQARYLDAPRLPFFGIGNEARKEARSFFSYSPASAGARLEVGEGRFKVGTGIDYRAIDVTSSDSRPSIGERFTPLDAPALERSNFTFVNSTAFASYDWRRRPGYTGSGGLYRLQFDDFRDRGHGTYSFQSLELEVQQLIPILRANWVVALRGLATMTDAGESGDVPFFMLPALGGGGTLRGYPDYRFIDRNRMLMTAEVRWTPARFLDMAIFYDTGKVTRHRRELGFQDLKSSYGIGMRVIGIQDYVMRIEVAHSREHAMRLIIGAGRAF